MIPHYDLTIPGWMTEEELEWLYQTATDMESIVEIGCYQGRSTLALCRAAAITSPVFAIDPWLDIMSNGEDNQVLFTANMAQGLFPEEFYRLRPWRMKSATAANFAPDVDMVFIDGDHSYESVKQDLELWKPKADILICGHDYHNSDWPGVTQAIDEFFGSARVQNPVGLIWSVWK